MRPYGYAHRRLRERWRPRVEAEAVACAICGGLILAGDPWDLSHDPVDAATGGTSYLGPSHRHCNRNTVLERRLRGRGRQGKGFRWVNRAW